MRICRSNGRKKKKYRVGEIRQHQEGGVYERYHVIWEWREELQHYHVQHLDRTYHHEKGNDEKQRRSARTESSVPYLLQRLKTR